jgi:hypothetical protein
VSSASDAVAAWCFPEIARGRIAALRTIVYSFIFVDVFFTTAWVSGHAYLPGPLYEPLFIGRALPLPVPTIAFVRGVEVALLVAAALALSGRFIRAAGAVVFVLYLEWMVIAFSYGKVDHERLAFLVALAVLPTVGAARWGDRSRDQASGWAVRCIQVAVVATYFLSVFAKLRFGGIEWLNGATLTRAVIMRGTFLAEPLEDLPGVLVGAQYLIVTLELASPLLFVRGALGRAWWWVVISFHLVTFAAIGIFFLPHVLCLLSFRRLERCDPRALVARARAPAPG